MSDAADEWFIRLHPVHRPDIDDITFSIRQLLKKGTSEVQVSGDKPETVRVKVEGGVIIGRKTSKPTGGVDAGYSSPIISRHHCQLLIDTSGQIFIKDLHSLHGSTIQRDHYAIKGDHLTWNVNSIEYHSVGHDDIIILGKDVISNATKYKPIQLQVQYRYPQVAYNVQSINGKRFESTADPYTSSSFAGEDDVDDIIQEISWFGAEDAHEAEPEKYGSEPDEKPMISRSSSIVSKVSSVFSRGESIESDHTDDHDVVKVEGSDEDNDEEEDHDSEDGEDEVGDCKSDRDSEYGYPLDVVDHHDFGHDIHGSDDDDDKEDSDEDAVARRYRMSFIKYFEEEISPINPTRPTLHDLFRHSSPAFPRTQREQQSNTSRASSVVSQSSHMVDDINEEDIGEDADHGYGIPQSARFESEILSQGEGRSPSPWPRGHSQNRFGVWDDEEDEDDMVVEDNDEPLDVCRNHSEDRQDIPSEYGSPQPVHMAHPPNPVLSKVESSTCDATSPRSSDDLVTDIALPVEMRNISPHAVVRLESITPISEPDHDSVSDFDFAPVEIQPLRGDDTPSPAGDAPFRWREDGLLEVGSVYDGTYTPLGSHISTSYGGSHASHDDVDVKSVASNDEISRDGSPVTEQTDVEVEAPTSSHEIQIEDEDDDDEDEEQRHETSSRSRLASDIPRSPYIVHRPEHIAGTFAHLDNNEGGEEPAGAVIENEASAVNSVEVQVGVSVSTTASAEAPAQGASSLVAAEDDDEHPEMLDIRGQPLTAFFEEEEPITFPVLGNKSPRGKDEIVPTLVGGEQKDDTVSSGSSSAPDIKREYKRAKTLARGCLLEGTPPTTPPQISITSLEAEIEACRQFDLRSAGLLDVSNFDHPSPSSTTTELSSEGPVTPPPTIMVHRKRSLSFEDIHYFGIVNAERGGVVGERPMKKVRGLAGTVGLVVLGAALGSVGTIAGLMQLAP